MSGSDQQGSTVKRMDYSLNNDEIERLAYLAEELGEAAQAVGKILRHGFDSDYASNVDNLESELSDVLMAVKRMDMHGDVSMSRTLRRFNEKIRRKDADPADANRWFHHQPPWEPGSPRLGFHS